MPNWQPEKAERNRKSLARLAKSLPGVLAPPGPRIRCGLARPAESIRERFPRASRIFETQQGRILNNYAALVKAESPRTGSRIYCRL